MWTRREIKEYAKDFLRKHYWKAFVVCFIAALFSSGGGSSNNDTHQDNIYYSNDYTVVQEVEERLPFELDNPVFNFTTKSFRSPLFIMGSGFSIIVILIFIILLITVGFAFEVGQSRFFLQGFKGDVSIRTMFSTFNSDEYLPIVITIFLRNLYILLWTFLLIIPGIVKLYEYRFVPYILAEKPGLSSNEVISRSREITRGHKMNIFVLDLSFLGWYLLGGLFFGIGVYFVNPYAQATNARLYNVLSSNEM